MRTHDSAVLNDTLTSYALDVYSYRCHVFSSLEKSSDSPVTCNWPDNSNISNNNFEIRVLLYLSLSACSC